jgi:hypothetical protein
MSESTPGGDKVFIRSDPVLFCLSGLQNVCILIACEPLDPGGRPAENTPR